MVSRRRLATGIALAVLLVGVAYLVVTAEHRALAAEEEYVTAQLEDEPCLESWGADEGAATERSSITGFTLGGVRANVSLPYAYSTQTDDGLLHADSASEASYVVTLFDVRRVTGDAIDPC